MSRKRTGLRNRFRSGRSTYSKMYKKTYRDTYGHFENGRKLRTEVIAGRALPFFYTGG